MGFAVGLPGEIEGRDPVADGREHGVAIRGEEQVALGIHRPQQLVELSKRGGGQCKRGDVRKVSRGRGGAVCVREETPYASA